MQHPLGEKGQPWLPCAAQLHGMASTHRPASSSLPAGERFCCRCGCSEVGNSQTPPQHPPWSLRGAQESSQQRHPFHRSITARGCSNAHTPIHSCMRWAGPACVSQAAGMHAENKVTPCLGLLWVQALAQPGRDRMGSLHSPAQETQHSAAQAKLQGAFSRGKRLSLQRDSV